MKTKRRQKIEEPYIYRERLRNQWRTRIFNLYMDNYDIDGLERDQREFVLRQFWAKGTVGAFKANTDPLIVEFPAWCVAGGINYYGQPVKGTILQRSGIQTFPTKEFTIFKGMEVFNEKKKYMVIGYANRSHTPIQDTVFTMIDEIVNVHMAIRTNVYHQKIPRILSSEPESKDEVENALEDAFNDELVALLSSKGIGSIQSFPADIPFKKDLVDYEKILINDLYTYLGFDNNGQTENKKERVGSDEINANNDIINRHGECIFNCMKEFFDDVNDCFGSSFSIRKRYSEAVKSIHEEGDNDDSNDDENGGDDDAS